MTDSFGPLVEDAKVESKDGHTITSVDYLEEKEEEDEESYHTCKECHSGSHCRNPHAGDVAMQDDTKVKHIDGASIAMALKAEKKAEEEKKPTLTESQ